MLLGCLLTSPATTVTETTKSANAEWVVVVGLGAFKQLAQNLVVAAGRQFEALLNKRFLWSSLVPPTALEIENCPVACREFHRR